MYRFPHGVEELEGIANRTDFDLGSHTRGQSELSIDADVMPNADSTARLATQGQGFGQVDGALRDRTVAGVDRGVLALLNEAYRVEELDNGRRRTVLGLKPHLAPIKAA